MLLLIGSKNTSSTKCHDLEEISKLSYTKLIEIQIIDFSHSVTQMIKPDSNFFCQWID